MARAARNYKSLAPDERMMAISFPTRMECSLVSFSPPPAEEPSCAPPRHSGLLIDVSHLSVNAEAIETHGHSLVSVKHPLGGTGHNYFRSFGCDMVSPRPRRPFPVW